MASMRLQCLLCLAFSKHVCSLHLRVGVPSGREIGAQVGANLRAADREIAAEVQQNGGRSEFQSGYLQAMTADEKILVNPAVSEVLNKVNRLAGSMVAKDGLCERRWDAKCPDGWSSTGSDQCIAPAGYGGACKKVQTFVGKTAAEKQRIAEECKAPWPCVDACLQGRDYDNLCPEGWSDSGDGFCDAPASFQTKCATSYDFAEMSLQFKQELAQTCGFNWKCKEQCEQDFSSACPEEWTEVPMNPGLCMAPPTYAGSCSFSVDTAPLSSAQRLAFGNKCAVKWPCAGPQK